MDDRRISLTPRATLRFGVYAGPAESVAEGTFTRPRRPNVLTGAAGREAFVRGFSGETIVVWTSLGPLPRWLPGPTTRWAPGTTRLALHGT
jgi:hypothetical protein